MYNYENVSKQKFGKPVSKSGNELIFTCVKCKRDKLYVNTKNGLFHCFRCGYKGKLRNKRYSLNGLKHDYEQLKKEVKSDKDKILKLIYFDRLPLTEEQMQALKSRGLTDSDIKYYNFCGRKEDERIQIPNFIKGNLTDIICAWEYDKEKVTKRNPKYLNTSGVDKSKTLFNIYNIEQNPSKIVLCEGIFNAITAGRNGVASFGCVLSNRQLELILEKEPKSILIAYDGDEPGVKGSMEALEMIKGSGYKGVVEYVLLPKNVDINDMGHDNFMDYYNNNKYIIDFNNSISVRLPGLLFNSSNK